MVGISQAESNNIKACALPSIHLPLTREGECDGAGRGEGCAFEKVVGMERSVGDPSVLRQIGLSKY